MVANPFVDFVKQHWGNLIFLIVVLVAVPLAEIPAFANAQVHGRLIFFACALGLFFILNKKKGFIKISESVPRGIQIALLVFVTIHWISLLWSPAFNDGLLNCLKISLCVIWFYAVVFLIKRFRFNLLPFCVILGFTSVVFFFIENEQLKTTAFVTPVPITYPSGVFANSNLFGEVALFMIPFHLLFFFQARGWIRFYALLSGLGLLLICAFCHSAGVAMGLALFFVLFWFIFSGINRRAGALSIIYRPLFFAGVLSIFIGGFLLKFSFNGMGVGNYFNRNIETIFSDEPPQLEAGNSSAQERIVLWRHTWEIIKEKPILGLGAGGWGHAIALRSFRHKEFQSDQRVFPAPHNDFLWVWSETGLLGLVSWLAVLGLGGIYCLKAIYGNGLFREKTIAAVVLSALASWCLLSWVAYPMGPVFHSVLFFLYLGIASFLVKNGG